MISESELRSYDSYHAWADSIVNHHTFAGGNNEDLQLKNSGGGDAFYYHDKKFMAKQPGAFAVAAIPYSILNLAGASYTKDYAFAASLVTWFSSALLAAISVGVFFYLLLLFGFSQSNSILVSVCYGLCTTLFPYTGIPHHDVFASSFLIIGFYLFYRFHINGLGRLWISSAVLGLVLFFSMLPALIVALIMTYCVYLNRKNVRNVLHLMGGFVLGNIPLMIFNAYYFGNPFLQANMVGNFKDTFFLPALANASHQLHQYLGISGQVSLTRYAPIVILGFAGLFRLNNKYKSEKYLFIGMILVHLFYLINIQTIGHCQYGPRYLMPLMPFAMIGLGAWFKSEQKVTLYSGIALVIILYSFLVNLMGALGNTMYCDLLDFGFIKYFYKLPILLSDRFPLQGLCIGLGVLILINRFARAIYSKRPI